MTGNVWIHRYGKPLSWWEALLFCVVFIMAAVLFVFAPLMTFIWLLIQVARP